MPGNSFIFSFSLRLLKIFLFALCIALFARWLGGIYEEASAHNIINRWNHQRFGDFYDMPENSLDLVFLGSSHSYCTFDPELFDELLGIRSYQMGMPLQHPDSTYYTLLEVLGRQTPGIVVMELYWDMLRKPFDLNQAVSFFEVLRNDGLIDDYIKNVFPLSEKVKYKMLPIRYQADFFAYRSRLIINRLDENYGLKAQINQIPGEEYLKPGGFIYCTYNMPEEKYTYANAFLNFDGKDWAFDKTQKKYISLIIDLCRENNIELFFVTAPIANISVDHIANYGYIHNTIADFAEENGIKYIDYNIVNINTGMLGNVNFRDDAHLNYSGSLIVGRHFAEWLKDSIINS